MTGPQPYAVMIIIVFGFLLIDIGDNYANQEFQTWTLKQKERKMFLERQSSLRDSTVYKKKVTDFESKLHPN
jgi:hypothetical protein